MSEERDKLKRKRALEDYCAMPPNVRSVNKLFQHYVQSVRENPENRAWVPTLNRSTLYEWKNRDNWETVALQRDSKMIDEVRKRADDLRRNGYSQVSLLIDDAVRTLSALLEPGIDERVRLNAATQILDRTGIINQEKVAGKGRGATIPDAAARGSLPSPDADEEELARWLSDARLKEKSGG